MYSCLQLHNWLSAQKSARITKAQDLDGWTIMRIICGPHCKVQQSQKHKTEMDGPLCR